MQFLKSVTVALAAAGMVSVATTALAAGNGSGPKLTYLSMGKIGAVAMNPYKIAPLTAIITNGGNILTDVSVRIVPKEGGQEIAYNVSDVQARTHGGIPIFGLYPDYMNTIEVSYTKSTSTTSERVEKEIYEIYAGPANLILSPSAIPGYDSVFPKATVVKVEPEFGDRLYLTTNMFPVNVPPQAKAIWNNPTGGALQWNQAPLICIYDTKGEIRWYLEPSSIYDPNSIYNAGIIHAFRQNKDGAFSLGYGQRYAKYDLLGREIFNRILPNQYADFSHDIFPMENGHYLIRTSYSDYLRPDGKHVHTVRDVIIEVDQNGNVMDEWRLFDILDPYRDVVMKVLDQGAVCLNIDLEKSGQTLSAEDLAKLDSSDDFGDIVGSGPGRNWTHTNSVQHDPTDDSIIISSRHQSAIIKIGRDKQVKWILGSPEGWNEPFASKVLKPVDKDGNAIKCENSKCEGEFDWTWAQHTGWRIPSMSDDKVLTLSAFDNGDGRGMEQPAMQSEKYSRAVVYKIDQEKMTVEQLWEYGKERGHDWYSMVTSLTEYQPDKNSVMVYAATRGVSITKYGGFQATPTINEFKWMANEPSVEIQLQGVLGYRAMPVDIDKAFNGPK